MDWRKCGLNWWMSGIVLSYSLLSCPLVLSYLLFVCVYVGLDVGFEGGKFCGGVGVFLKNPVLIHIMTGDIPFHIKLCILLNTIKWRKWRGLVDRPFLYMFFSHHQTQVQGNKTGKKKRICRRAQHSPGPAFCRTCSMWAGISHITSDVLLLWPLLFID